MTIDEQLHPLDAPESEAPAELVRALRTLGRERPSMAALSATAMRLQARLDAPGSLLTESEAELTLESQAGTASVTPKLLGGRLAVAALALGLGVAAIALRPAASHQPAADASGATVPSVASAVREPGRPLETTPQPAAPNQVAPSPRTAVDLPAASHAELAAPAVPLAAFLATQRTPASPAAVPASRRLARKAAHVASRPRDGVPAAPRAAAQSHTAGLSRTSASSSSDSTQVPRPVVPRSELELLLQARSLSQTDPASALQTLAEHARRFPRGLLAPEREVLAIDALRALGKTEQADARLRAFRAAYPDSIRTPGVVQGAR